MKFASIGDLNRISYTLTEAGMKDFSPRAREFLRLFVALARIGYGGINAPMGAIVDAQKRIGGRYKLRSAFMALSELESKGMVSRRQFRVGADHFSTLIKFDLDRFVFWTGRRGSIVSLSQVGNCIKKGHNVGYVQTLQKDTVSIKNTVIPSNTNSLVINNKIGYRATNLKYNYKTTDGKTHKWLPVLFTLLCLTKSPRAPELRRAIREIASGNTDSGIDWAFWNDRWLEMPVSVREITAKRELLPMLRADHRSAELAEHQAELAEHQAELAEHQAERIDAHKAVAAMLAQWRLEQSERGIFPNTA